MKTWPIALAAFLAACSAALAQSPPPAIGGQAPVTSYCWNGTALVVCGSSGTSGGAGAVGAAGVNGTTAQSVQGLTGGVPVPTITGSYTPLGCRPWQAITTGAAVLLSAFSGGIPAGATLVDIVPSVTVVMRDDGSAPTTVGPGIPIQTNTIYPYSGSLSAVQFIAQTTSGTISTCFYR